MRTLAVVLPLLLAAGTLVLTDAVLPAGADSISGSASVPSLSSLSSSSLSADEAHSMFSWDFSDALGSKTWWPLWYPACGLRYQSPIDIETAALQQSTETLVMETIDMRPFMPLYAVVAFNSTFNVVRCDLSYDDVRLRFYWQPADADSGAEEDKGPAFHARHMSLYFPSEHFVDGAQTAAEVRFVFSSTDAFPLEEETALDDAIDSRTTVSISIMLKEVQDGEGDSGIELLLSQLFSGYSSGVTRITPFIPSFASLMQYKGSMTTPPCRGNVQHFVGGTVYPIEASTLHRFKQYGPNWRQFRPPCAMEGRVVRRVGFSPVGLSPDVRAAPAPVAYTLSLDSKTVRARETTLALYYASVEVGIVCVVLALTLLLLGWRRLTYEVPYSLTWRLPGTRREVFGVPLRYGTETGRPKIALHATATASAPSTAGASYADFAASHGSAALAEGSGAAVSPRVPLTASMNSQDVHAGRARRTSVFTSISLSHPSVRRLSRSEVMGLSLGSGEVVGMPVSAPAAARRPSPEKKL